MNIYEFADIINKNIIITRYANQNGRFSAHFDRCNIAQGDLLRGEYGDGKTPQEALNNYKNAIAGKTLVFNAMSDTNRQEYVAPKIADV
jgi:hypothetical protein